MAGKSYDALNSFFTTGFGGVATRMAYAASVTCTKAETVLLSIIKVYLPLGVCKRLKGLKGAVLDSRSFCVRNYAFNAAHSA